MSGTTCTSYAGAGYCKYASSRNCSYHKGRSICGVKGDLAGKTRCKTELESKKEVGKGFTQKMNGIGSL